MDQLGRHLCVCLLRLCGVLMIALAIWGISLAPFNAIATVEMAGVFLFGASLAIKPRRFLPENCIPKD